MTPGTVPWCGEERTGGLSLQLYDNGRGPSTPPAKAALREHGTVARLRS
jgi:hypothetical protein